MDEDKKRQTESRAFADLARIARLNGIMPELFQFSVESARANMQLAHHLFNGYSEFAQRCTTCRRTEDLIVETAHLSERIIAGYSKYFHDVANATGRATQSKQLGSYPTN